MVTRDGAVLDQTRTYRYRLTRGSASVVNNPPTLWVMLNPSTADETANDPTITKLLGFTSRWAHEAHQNRGELAVVNLFALRATDPKMLRVHDDPVGPKNDDWLTTAGRDTSRNGGRIVVAWGAHPFARRRARVVTGLLRTFGQLWCLGTTKDGSPRHPLYVPYSQPLVPWEGYR